MPLQSINDKELSSELPFYNSSFKNQSLIYLLIKETSVFMREFSWKTIYNIQKRLKIMHAVIESKF